MNNQRAMLKFRESFRGYNKEDVNSYIEQINIRFSKREIELKDKIALLEGQGLKTETNETVNTDYSVIVNDLNSQIEELKKQISILSEENQKLKSASEKTISEAPSDLSSQVGNILIIANENAQKIINEANNQAAKIKTDAELAANTKYSELEAKMKVISDSYIASCNQFVEEAKSKFEDISGKIKARTEALRSQTAEKSSQLEKEISENYINSESL